MDDAFFMLFTKDTGAVTAVLTVIDEPPALKRVVITGPGGVYDLYFNPQQCDELVKALQK